MVKSELFLFKTSQLKFYPIFDKNKAINISMDAYSYMISTAVLSDVVASKQLPLRQPHG